MVVHTLDTYNRLVLKDDHHLRKYHPSLHQKSSVECLRPSPNQKKNKTNGREESLAGSDKESFYFSSDSYDRKVISTFFFLFLSSRH